MPRTKEEIRSALLKLRNEMPPAEAARRSAQIFDTLRTLPEFGQAEVIHSYVSSKRNEVDTHAVLQYAFAYGKRVMVPVVDSEAHRLLHSEISSLNDLSPGTFGILEPKRYLPARVSDAQLVIVPTIAVDRSGKRVGFGSGYYDSFLKEVHCPTVALAFDFQVVDEVPQNMDDMKVQVIITETEIIRCR